MKGLFAICLLAALGAASPAWAGEARRFAIVIGNNHSDQPDALDLRYADDDAIAMHELLIEAGVDSVLLVRPDADTREQLGRPAAAGPPRWQELAKRLGELEGRIRAANRDGAATSLLVFYSGHGNVAHGEGYVELEDAHLTRTLLRRQILERTRAHDVHLIVDACRSYYLAFEKGPGGKRRPIMSLVTGGSGRARTGYVLSTSSDRESHEWEQFQGGIFSHEVRSALRGAADADRDGSVSYAELGAFLSVANRGIRNARFRPDFVVRPPATLADELLRWPAGSEALLIDAPEGHLYVEGPTGERLVDVHPAPDAVLAIHLPAARPLFVRRQDSRREYIIQDRAALTRLSDLAGARVRVASKGALHIAFQRLFSVPFGAAEVEAFRDRFGAAQAGSAPGQIVPVSVVSAAPAEGATGSSTRTVAGATAIAAGALALGLGGWALERSLAARDAPSQLERSEINGTISDLRLGAGVSLGVGLAAGATWLWLRHRDADRGSRLGIAPDVTSGAVGLSLFGGW
jgi:hypothetical protein